MSEQKTIVKKTKKEGILYTDIGSNIQPVYERVFDEKTGKSVVKQVDTFDIDEYIQASNCKTDLAMLRAEMISTGQLPSVTDEVVDATLFPENIHELYATIKNVNGVYDSLPAAVKNVFKDKDAFMTALIDGTYEQKLMKGLQAVYEGQDKQEEEKKEGNAQ